MAFPTVKGYFDIKRETQSLLLLHENHKPCPLCKLLFSFPFLHAALCLYYLCVYMIRKLCPEYVRQPYHKLNFWHAFKYASNLLVIQVNVVLLRQ